MSEGTRTYVIHSDSECERLEQQARLGRIEDHFRHIPTLPEDGRILDLGCGSGSMTRLFAARHPKADVWGVDLREEYLEDARVRANALPNAYFRAGDVFKIPFPDGHFDLVWSKYLMQFIKEPLRAIAECIRVTKSGGTVMHCAYDDFLMRNDPPNASLQKRLERVFPQLVDVNIGRKLAPAMLSSGLRNVKVFVEEDPISTSIGTIKPEIRENLQVQFDALKPYLEKILGSTEAGDELGRDMFNYWDDPQTCTVGLLYLVKGIKA